MCCYLCVMCFLVTESRVLRDPVPSACYGQGFYVLKDNCSFAEILYVHCDVMLAHDCKVCVLVCGG